MKADNPLLAAAGILGFASVAMGAVIDHVAGGANHALETAVRYNQTYAVLVAALACAQPVLEGRARHMTFMASWLFVAGIFFFSGGIYVAELAGLHSFVYAAPMGGFVLMAAWIVTLLAAIA